MRRRLRSLHRPNAAFDRRTRGASARQSQVRAYARRADGTLRVLRYRIKAADGFDFVAGKLDAHRQLAVEREKIDDAAAHGHVAAFVDLELGVITEFDESFLEVLEIEALAEGKRKAEGGELG